MPFKQVDSYEQRTADEKNTNYALYIGVIICVIAYYLWRNKNDTPENNRRVYGNMHNMCRKNPNYLNNMYTM